MSPRSKHGLKWANQHLALTLEQHLEHPREMKWVVFSDREGRPVPVTLCHQVPLVLSMKVGPPRAPPQNQARNWLIVNFSLFFKFSVVILKSFRINAFSWHFGILFTWLTCNFSPEILKSPCLPPATTVSLYVETLLWELDLKTAAKTVLPLLIT